ncbi:zinc-binding metallopeptidase family protein [Novosphingobium malaysiense]|uniref:Zinc-ribbon domain-containing protein n=1 Tax=Novosphingobium malaysiense TaxID=1348853 RepID=A0A0B1ZPN0_9SPHN|nr:putative zinc-binding metallopeptidase [Novosphingobium malaysiense]KHK91112.1 hypothetical protein LK12_09360 [Novosphingobium malaysiense]
MRAFACPNCHSPIHFEARLCHSCRATLGYDPAIDAFRFLADGATVWRDAHGGISDVVVCANNNDFRICNWLVDVDAPTHMCRACCHNRTIPDLTDASVPQRWAKVEAAKRRLIHTLIRLGLPLETKAQEAPGRQGLAFDFLHDPAAETMGQTQILTGHDGGVITLNLIEADDAERERMRAAMGEPYRTLLGHFRHEVGHHYWSRLVQNDQQELEAFRSVFGDERRNYEEALSAYYADSGKIWTDAYVSHYATSHPWEDFAETWAHYLHIVDVLATANALDLSLEVPDAAQVQAVDLAFDPYRANAAKLASHMEPLAFAMNAMNRSMGKDDLYPFALSDAIVVKLDYIARLIGNNRLDG